MGRTVRCNTAPFCEDIVKSLDKFKISRAEQAEPLATSL